MLGRSDGVLNPQGVRFGSAELYQIVEEMKDECVSSSVFITPSDYVRQSGRLHCGRSEARRW